MNEIEFSSYSKTQSFNYSAGVFFFSGGGGGGKSPDQTALIKTSDACNVQSELDLHCKQKVIMSSLAVKDLYILIRSMVVL